MARAADWTKRVAAWRASGLGAAEFCAGQGYCVKSLWHWSSKLARTGACEGDDRGKRKATVQLARVARSTLSAVTTEPGSIVIEIDGARLTVRGRVEAAALRAVITGLRSVGEEASR